MSGMSRTGRGRGRARAEIAVVRVLEKRLGALPVVAEFGRRLRIAEIVDELCPVREVAWISRALDAVAPQLDEITGSVGAAAISEFGVDAARLHWDMSAPRSADRSSGGERPPPPSCRSKAVKLRAV